MNAYQIYCLIAFYAQWHYAIWQNKRKTPYPSTVLTCPVTEAFMVVMKVYISDHSTAVVC